MRFYFRLMMAIPVIMNSFTGGAFASDLRMGFKNPKMFVEYYTTGPGLRASVPTNGVVSPQNSAWPGHVWNGTHWQDAPPEATGTGSAYPSSGYTTYSSAQPLQPPSPPVPYFDGGKIVIFSPPSNNQQVQYTLNGTSYVMAPGTEQRFTNDRKWTIKFYSGNLPPKEYTLSSGSYKFTPTDGGLGLFSTQDAP